MPGESGGNKSLHFVWAGAMMNEASQTVIKEWRLFLDSIKATERSENFTICVWLDADNSHPDVIAAIKEALGHDGIVYRDLNQLQQPGIKDVIDYEIKRLPPNYGAVSDIARYAILEQEGGMYLDTDVRPPGQGEFAATYQAVSDEQIFPFITAWLNKEAFMYCDAREDSQLAQAAPDLLISPKPHHPLLQAITKQVVKQYATTYGYEAALSRAREIDIDTYESSPISTLSSQTYYARDPGVIHLTGVIKAGPSFFNHMLAVHGNHQVQAILERHLRTPLGITNSAYSWKARGIPKCASLEEVLERSRATIIFELEHTGILRMDDHLINALEALDGQGVEASEVKMQMLNLFNDVLSQEHFHSQIVCCQLTFAFKEVEDLITKFQLEDKTGILPSKHLPSSSFLKGVQPHPGQINGDRSFSLALLYRSQLFSSQKPSSKSPTNVC